MLHEFINSFAYACLFFSFFYLINEHQLNLIAASKVLSTKCRAVNSTQKDVICVMKSSRMLCPKGKFHKTQNDFHLKIKHRTQFLCISIMKLKLDPPQIDGIFNIFLKATGEDSIKMQSKQHSLLLFPSLCNFL